MPEMFFVDFWEGSCGPHTAPPFFLEPFIIAATAVISANNSSKETMIIVSSLTCQPIALRSLAP
jgi:hypothetical protein